MVLFKMNVQVLIMTLFTVAIDLAILAESIPRRWSFVLPGLAGVWGVGNVFTGLIGKSYSCLRL